MKEKDKGIIISNLSKPPANLINQETFVSILVDFHLLEGAHAIDMVEARPMHVNQLVYQEIIYKKYGVSKSDFTASLNYYSSNYKLIQEIYESAINELIQLQAANQ